MIELHLFRVQCYNLAAAKLRRAVGAAVHGSQHCSPITANLQHLPAVRALALAGKLATLAYLLAAAKHQASGAGLTGAVRTLREKEQQLAALEAEVSDRPVLLDDDWGKRGRGRRIIAWIRLHKPDARTVAEKFQLALSTAKRYVRQAKKGAK